MLVTILVIGVGVRDIRKKLGERFMPVINQQQLGTRTIYQHQSGNSRYYTVSGDNDLAEGERLASVSTVLGIVNKPGLVNWAVGLAKQGLDHIEERDKAAEAGTKIHKLIQDYLDTDEYKPGIDGIDLVAAAMLARFVEWYKQSGITITATEKMVYHPKFKYAGTLDAMGHDSNGNLVVLDWKSGGLWPEMSLQLAAYGAALSYHADSIEKSPPKVRGVVVGLKNSPVEEKEVDDMYGVAINMFSSALYLYTNLKDTKAVSVWRK